MSGIVRLRNFITVSAVVLCSFLVACNHDPNVTEVSYSHTAGCKIYLLTQSDGANNDDADLLGTLLLAEGCFQIDHEATPIARPVNIIWPEGFGIAIDGDEILILDDERRVATRVGERTLLGGSGSDKRSERHGGCEGPAWYAGPDVFSGDDIPSVFE